LASNPLDINPYNGSGQSLKDFQLTTNVPSKLDLDYGRKVAQNIYGTIYGNQSYFWIRNNRFRKNRQIANGKIDMSVFLDRLEMNGKNNYVNINWKSIVIGNTIVSRLVGSWMNRREKINVTAVDPTSANIKKEIADEAEFVYQNKEILSQLQQESGIPVIPQDQFIAEDKEDLDLWVSEFNRLPEEIKYSLGINNIFDANGWNAVLKHRILHDSAEVGLVCTYTWMDDEGQIHVDWIRPENAIYSYSDFADFRDTTYRGHISSMKISEVRARYGKAGNGNLSEEEIFKIAQFSKEYQLTDKIKWMQDWNVAYLRPYDEWNIDLMNFEIRTLDSDGYTVTKTKKNGSTIIRKGKPEKLDDNQEYVEEKKWNIYKGVYCPNTKTMLEWGIKKNMIRPQDPKEMGDAEFSYSFYMYDLYDMRNVAVPEKIEEPIEQMILARLKIQQMVSKMVPAGASIDVDALQELDLGLGDSVKPLDVQKIWEQTGKLYYRGRDAEGNRIPVPINELANTGFAPQLQALIQLYQFHYQVLKDELGEDPNLMNQAAQPRVAASNIEASRQLANNATDYMYDAYLYVMEETGKKVACLLNKSVTHGSKKYRDILRQEEVKDRNFLAKVQMLPTDLEIVKLEAMMNNSITANPQLVLYLDPFKIMRVAKENVELAELYFRQAQKKYIKTEQEKAQTNSEQNAQIQQASMQAKAQGDAALQSAQTQSRQKEIVLQGLFDLAKAGIPVPSELQQVVSGVIQNFDVPLEMENQQMMQSIQQQQMEQEQQMQQEGQAQQQEQPQEEMIEEQEQLQTV
jgi:hypothetical protein|tara:strand:+ start:7021 stop:9417 length:2397 start_codon:yes stop_codon:yes gene_type:complete